MPFHNAEQLSRVTETARMRVAGEPVFIWSVPQDRTITKFFLTITNKSTDRNAVLKFRESDGSPAEDNRTVIGIPQSGGAINDATDTTSRDGIIHVETFGGFKSTFSDLVVTKDTNADFQIDHNITNVALTSNVATVTLDSVSGLNTGDAITVACSNSIFTGAATITGVNTGAKTITFALTHANVGSVAATGTVIGVRTTTSITVKPGAVVVVEFTTRKHYIDAVPVTANDALIHIFGRCTSMVTQMSRDIGRATSSSSAHQR